MFVLSIIMFCLGCIGILSNIIKYAKMTEEETENWYKQRGNFTFGWLIIIGIIGTWLIDWDMIPWIT